ncbi:hypothetical protein M5689_003701 [Euphorbia peplus]|nr:hypothetical protein M5689_003701 [Euphorbia peplus]
MLLNRLRAVSSNNKQALMTDHKSSQSSSASSSIHNYTKPLPSFLASPRFKPFTFKGMPESSDPLISPTSILEPFSPRNPFCSHTFHLQSPKKILKLDSKNIGVALVCEHDDKQTPNKNNKMVLFGTKLEVLIPPPASFTIPASDSPNSPSDFGIKTKISQFSKSGFENSSNQIKFSPQVITRNVSMSDLELSEDYTCVISYGPNPKTTHIYDNYVLENFTCDNFKSSPKSFLSFCHSCDKKLEQKNDIFIYRGDEAFCSQECRYRKMVLDGIQS